MAGWLKGNVIGSGSFGTVHLALDTSTGALFVAKSAKTESGIMSLKNEAEILENLDSPYIVKCIGKDVSFTKNGETNYNLFFEYMAGGSLSDLSQKFGRSLDERLIRLYTREILQGLKYLHKNGIVHSDIKCKNVLVDSLGAVKISDFGCAKRVNGEKSRKCCINGIGGTPLWMAPEVLRNEGLDFAADIWSLGCTVIEMATGKQPWGGDAGNPMAALLKISKGNDVPEFPKCFSNEGLDFLSKCLVRDPRKRWTSEQLLRHPFVVKKGGILGNLRKGASFSPTSVVDFASYESDDHYSSDDDDDGYDDDKIPFAVTKCSFEEQKLLVSKCESRNVFEASEEDWITVRSR